MKHALTQKRLRELLDYDRRTGVFTWRVNGRGCGGNQRIDKEAGSIDTKGRRQIRVDGILYFAHRLVFLWVRGTFPINQVDHINQNFTDNRWGNLREATNSQNSVNRNSVRRRHSDLPRGVHPLPSGRFCAVANGKHIGSFDTIAEAETAYRQKAAELFGDYLPKATHSVR